MTECHCQGRKQLSGVSFYSFDLEIIVSYFIINHDCSTKHTHHLVNVKFNFCYIFLIDVPLSSIIVRAPSIYVTYIHVSTLVLYKETNTVIYVPVLDTVPV